MRPNTGEDTEYQRSSNRKGTGLSYFSKGHRTEMEGAQNTKLVTFEDDFKRKVRKESRKCIYYPIQL